MKTDNQGAPWWTNLSSNSESNKTEKDENIVSPLRTEEYESKTKELIHSYKRIIDKNTELMRLLMTSFKAQADQLDKLVIV